MSFMDFELSLRAVRKGEQPPWIISDGLWERIEPLLPQVERNFGIRA